MKRLILLISLLINGILYAQNKLPIVKATSSKAIIIEGIDEKSNWHISPAAQPDIHTINKSPKSKWVRFYTDIDSIQVKLKPGKHFDFIVLLNGKDSCLTRLESPVLKSFAHTKPELHDTIPFTLTEYNNIKLIVVLDHQDTMFLKFDSGATDFLLTNTVIKDKLQLNSLKNHHFQLGKQEWSNQTIYPVELTGQGTEGRFGWNIFDGKIVEIDYEKSLFIVHSRLPKPDKSYQKLPIEYTHRLFCINGSLQV